MKLNLTKQRGKNRTFILDSFGQKNALYPLDLSDNSPCVVFGHKIGGFGYQNGGDLVHGCDNNILIRFVIESIRGKLPVFGHKIGGFGTKIYRFFSVILAGSITKTYTNGQNYPFLWLRISSKLFPGLNTGAVNHG